MNKVTSINLNGRVYQLEEQAFAALHQYLEQAKTALGQDPDKAEILTDLEQSIAEKCDRYLNNSKDVVTEKEIGSILKTMGPVEAADNDTEKEPASTNVEPPRRLYLVKEGAMLAGVCSGLGAYFGIPANVVRVLFVLLTIFTSGIWIVAYIALALLLPAADSDEKLAQAYGKPTTAQQVIERAKDRATNPEMLSTVGKNIMRVWRVVARLVTLAGAVAIAAFSAAWIMSLWAIGLGRTHFQGNLAHLNGWPQWLFITSVYLLAVIPAILICRLFNRIAADRVQTKRSTIGESSLAVLWGVALVTVVSLASLNAHDFQTYVHEHKGYLDIGGHHLCVDDNKCNPDYNYRNGVLFTPKDMFVAPVPPVPGATQ